MEDYDRHFYPRLHFEDDRKLPPVKPGDGYYSTTAIADHAIEYLREHAERHSGEPFFEYLAFISPHFPIQAPAEDIARQKGRYDDGWDEIRTRRWKRQRELGIVDCAASDRDPDTVPSWNLPEAELRKRIGPGEVGRAAAWEQLTREQKTFQAAKMEVHAAMVDRIDREIGRVLDQLDAMGAADDTLVLFLSDNGASAEQIIRGDGHDPAAAPGSPKSFLGIGPGWSTACNTPLRLHKSWVHEGGISTPLIVRWPRGIAARGELRHNPGHLIDLAPTILELAGGHWPAAWGDAKVPPPPGKSLAPVFARDGAVSHDYFWWFHEGNRAVRVGDWKLVSQFSVGKEMPWELYDLTADRCEMKDLAARQPERVKELEKAWADHMAEFKALAKQGLPPKAREVPDQRSD